MVKNIHQEPNLQQIADRLTFQHQADAAISQANPVSAALYTVLDTTVNMRIISIEADVTWTVQPTPLEVIVTIDGQTINFSKPNPASGTDYAAYVDSYQPANSQWLSNTPYGYYRAFLFEGRSVKVEARTTGGTVSNLSCRVKYAKR